MLEFQRYEICECPYGIQNNFSNSLEGPHLRRIQAPNGLCRPRHEGQQLQEIVCSCYASATELEHFLRSPAEIDKINQFVTLCTAATASFAPPAAVLGLTFLFVKWLSDAALENAYVAGIRKCMIC